MKKAVAYAGINSFDVKAGKYLLVEGFLSRVIAAKAIFCL
jgi:hypothetical protein